MGKILGIDISTEHEKAEKKVLRETRKKYVADRTKYINSLKEIKKKYKWSNDDLKTAGLWDSAVLDPYITYLHTGSTQAIGGGVLPVPIEGEIPLPGVTLRPGDSQRAAEMINDAMERSLSINSPVARAFAAMVVEQGMTPDNARLQVDGIRGGQGIRGSPAYLNTLQLLDSGDEKAPPISLDSEPQSPEDTPPKDTPPEDTPPVDTPKLNRRPADDPFIKSVKRARPNVEEKHETTKHEDTGRFNEQRRHRNLTRDEGTRLWSSTWREFRPVPHRSERGKVIGNWFVKFLTDNPAPNDYMTNEAYKEKMRKAFFNSEHGKGYAEGSPPDVKKIIDERYGGIKKSKPPPPKEESPPATSTGGDIGGDDDVRAPDVPFDDQLIPGDKTPGFSGGKIIGRIPGVREIDVDPNDPFDMPITVGGGGRTITVGGAPDPRPPSGNSQPEDDGKHDGKKTAIPDSPPIPPPPGVSTGEDDKPNNKKGIKEKPIPIPFKPPPEDKKPPEKREPDDATTKKVDDVDPKKPKGYGYLRPFFDLYSGIDLLEQTEREQVEDIKEFDLYDIPIPVNESFDNPVFMKTIAEKAFRFSGIASDPNLYVGAQVKQEIRDNNIPSGMIPTENVVVDANIIERVGAEPKWFDPYNITQREFFGDAYRTDPNESISSFKSIQKDPDLYNLLFYTQPDRTGINVFSTYNASNIWQTETSF